MAKPLTLNKLASLVANREGKKSQVKIGDVREVFRILQELSAESFFYDSEGPIDILFYGPQYRKVEIKVHKRLEKLEDKE